MHRNRFALSPRHAVLFLLALLLPGEAHPQSAMLEAEVKATYLYKLAQFVTWPPGALPSGPFTVCVVGGRPFSGLLDQAVQGAQVQQHPIVVRHYASIRFNPGCQVMFVTASDPQQIAAMLAAVRGSPVLTVTDSQQETDATGIINFVLVDGRVRFQIDRRAAAQNGLIISSKLLSLAVSGAQ